MDIVHIGTFPSAQRHIFTSKSFLQIRKTNLLNTVDTKLEEESDCCYFDSDKSVGAGFCPRGQGHRIGVKDSETERRLP